MRVQALSAVIFTSPEPARLAGFYRQRLGLDFASHQHGDQEAHHEAMLGDMRFAVVPGPAGVSPTFLVNDLDRWVAALGGTVRQLGQGKRLALLRDPDGNGLQLIDLGFAV